MFEIILSCNEEIKTVVININMFYLIIGCPLMGVGESSVCMVKEDGHGVAKNRASNVRMTFLL